ncbi:helix-turn-helix domain-containing protein [Flavobacterium sp. ST-75]|uniref:Helix-turn-helix domain-containing protein n=1 Tax=Flavobacterium rhizophilum TaxID=3163296 RepID=A0ABW8Y929_9FLAO
MKHLKTVSELHRDLGWAPPENPMFSIVSQFSDQLPEERFSTDCYLIRFDLRDEGIPSAVLPEGTHGNGAMRFIHPGTDISAREITVGSNGFVIVAHKDFFRGQRLAQSINTYHFFQYYASESLFFAPCEAKLITSLKTKMEREYYNNTDEYSKDIILSHYEAMLIYVKRFYKRQFRDQMAITDSVSERFKSHLETYIKSGLLKRKGIPAAAHFAKQQQLSPYYLNDVLQFKTGNTVEGLVLIALIAKARELLSNSPVSIEEIAYTLGFKEIKKFALLFTKMEGYPPEMFRTPKGGSA